jgi:membrane-associated phospholipid phosphatase
MKTQLQEVKKYSEKATREELAIVYKWADGAGTYAPPGHWNDIAAEYISNAQWSEVRMARAFALLNMALHDAAVGCWETKYFYFNPRPSQLDPSIKVKTGLPNFPAYTSGHSTFSASAAAVLSYLFPNNAQFFNDQAKEASLSRLYGAIHYRADIEVGLAHGNRIGSYTVNFAKDPQKDGGD